jgi:hypothetical protein
MKWVIPPPEIEDVVVADDPDVQADSPKAPSAPTSPRTIDELRPRMLQALQITSPEKSQEGATQNKVPPTAPGQWQLTE